MASETYSHPWEQKKPRKCGAPKKAGLAPVLFVRNLFELLYLDDLTIKLDVGGETRQQAKLGDMVWSIPEIIADLSTLYTLHAGDLIMTGTPAGVGPVVKGDVLRGTIGDFAPVETRII